LKSHVETLPLYLQVADRLENTIARSATGTELPSEHTLAHTYRVSRLTARAALEELERRYLVRRSQGRRTRVARRVDYVIGPHWPASWSESVRLGGANPRSITERLQLRRPPAAIRATLGLGTEDALHLKRSRYVDDELAAIADTWLNPRLVPMLAERLSADGSLYRTFNDVYRLDPRRKSARAEFVVAPAAVARRLGQEGRPIVVKLTGCTAASNGNVIECTTSWLRADVFNVVFELLP